MFIKSKKTTLIVKSMLFFRNFLEKDTKTIHTRIGFKRLKNNAKTF